MQRTSYLVGRSRTSKGLNLRFVVRGGQRPRPAGTSDVLGRTAGPARSPQGGDRGMEELGEKRKPTGG